MKKLLTSCLMALCMTVQAQLATYPEGLRTGMPHNDDYMVRVRIPGGEWKDLFEYNVQVDMDKVQDASMVQFDMGSPVEVMVKKNNGTISQVDIRPQSKSIPFHVLRKPDRLLMILHLWIQSSVAGWIKGIIPAAQFCVVQDDSVVFEKSCRATPVYL